MGLFGDAMSKFRKKRGWSMRYLAIMVDIAQSYMSRIERGIEVPSAALARRIAKALGVGQEAFVEFAREDKKKFFDNYVDEKYPKGRNDKKL